MPKTKPHLRCAGQTTSNEYHNWVFSRMPAVGRLVDSLDSGKSPGPLAVMAALSDMVAYYTDSSCRECVR